MSLVRMNLAEVSPFDFIWFIFFLWVLSPQLKIQLAKQRRKMLMKAIEKKRGSKVITLVHQFTSISFLGMLMGEFITIDDSKKILKIIRQTPENKPIDLVVHTPGGMALAADQIARALANHKGKITVIVPHHALSGGTYLALAADKILMDENAILGRVDPQIFRFPAASITTVMKKKSIDEIKDQTITMADMAEKALKQIERNLKWILGKSDYKKVEIKKITEELAMGKYTHDHPVSFSEAQELGLRVVGKIPPAFHRLMDMYPEERRRRAAVQTGSDAPANGSEEENKLLL